MKLVPKVGFKKWARISVLNIPTGKMKDILPEIFHWNDPESLFPFTFQLDFDETFCKWETTEERKQSRDYF